MGYCFQREHVCVFVCHLSRSIFLAFGSSLSHLVASRSDVKCVRFFFFLLACVCVCAQKVNAEARHSVALEMRLLFSTTPCFSLDIKTSKSFRTEIHLVCNPDAGSPGFCHLGTYSRDVLET